ncbi:SGNH hydrolase domain-containing protein [Nocardioides rubriscoriae]|uniref:SGNH hydrolase domain-containing protein n=1 Tax=Nocardioides rubriscoriae TaxID=642762 RepID=UPI0011DF361C|nr:SGNH hydrolase domain-containing protein [Nocardioides rubriscoriae]
MKMRSLISLVVTAVATAVLATLLVTSTTSTAQAAPEQVTTATAVSAKPRNPSQDFPRMPRECATPKEKIPAKPVVCQLNPYDADRPTIVLWGDSHSWMFIPALKAAVQGRGVNLIGVMMGSCPPMDNQVAPDDSVPACFRSNALAIDVARKLEASGRPYRIVLAGSWQRYVHARKVRDRVSYVGMMAAAMVKATPRLARTLKAIGSDVDVIGQVATVPERHRDCAKGNEPYSCQLARGKSLPEAAATRRYVAQALKPVLGTRKPIDVNARFCGAKVCRGLVGSTHTWFDDLHLSATMSATLKSYFTRTVDAVVPSTEPPPVDPGCPLIIFC